jgi:hypothetical protein
MLMFATFYKPLQEKDYRYAKYSEKIFGRVFVMIMKHYAI